MADEASYRQAMRSRCMCFPLTVRSARKTNDRFTIRTQEDNDQIFTPVDLQSGEGKD